MWFEGRLCCDFFLLSVRVMDGLVFGVWGFVFLMSGRVWFSGNGMIHNRCFDVWGVLRIHCSGVVMVWFCSGYLDSSG